jgi:hypothetical protein
MRLEEIYDRDIHRHINAAVTVGDKRSDVVKAEIAEYVFTDELIERFYQFLDTILNASGKKTGVWINGYYGSGKSHFIKYIYYLIDPKTSAEAFDALSKAVENYDGMQPGANDRITPSNVRTLYKKLAESECENILFNIGDWSDDNERSSLTNIFLDVFNKFRGYNPKNIPLAILLEKTLDEHGVFEEFKKKINTELGFDWEKDADDVASFQLQDVLEIAKSLYSNLDIDSLRATLTNAEAYKIGVKSRLIPELQDYLEKKGDNYRLVFLVDEVSQYIGANKELLLNLQNIVERVSEDCGGKIWIACTAQQSLDEVSQGADGVTDVKDEFGKILGRFDTRISLQSNDASYITQRRVLDKSSKGIEVLGEMFDSNRDYIENQFKISHELYKGYGNRDEFISSYPFVPYQFKLIAHVFEAFQQLGFVIKEVKDNERSVLGITHFTAKEHAKDEVGGFMPFDAFYNKQFHTNLTHRGNRAIQNALDLTYVKNHPFAQRVVKGLFMISNLLQSQRQTFPSNIDNLTVILMDQRDQNRLQLQSEITEVLNKLMEESIIREENGNFYFFNEDEMDVQNLIKSQTIALDDRLTTFHELFTPVVRISQKVDFGQNSFRVGYFIEQKEVFRNGDFNLIVFLTDPSSAEKLALNATRKDLVLCVNEWFSTNESLKKDFQWYAKTSKYFINNSGGTGERQRTNDAFRVRNSQLKDRLTTKFADLFAETRFISLQQVVESDQISGSKPSDRLSNAIQKHLEGIYKNHHLADDYAKNQSELKAAAASNQTLLPNLTPAEQMLNDFIRQNNDQINIYDLINNFEKEPFGWRWEAILDIAIKLVRKKKREFKYKKNPRYPVVDFINKAVSTAERTSCEIVSGEDIGQDLIDEGKAAFQEIFNVNLPAYTDAGELSDELQDKIQARLEEYEKLRGDYSEYPFSDAFQKAVVQLTALRGIRDTKKFFDDLISSKTESKVLIDDAKGIHEFAGRALKDYRSLRDFYRKNRDNFDELGEALRESADRIEETLQLADPRKDFRHALKARDEIEKAINEKLVALKAEVLNRYEAMYNELKEEAKARDVDPAILGNKDYTLTGIREATSLMALKMKGLQLDGIRTEILQKILDASSAKDGSKASDQKTYYVSRVRATISNQEELEAFLKEVKKDLQKILEEKNQIILR